MDSSLVRNPFEHIQTFEWDKAKRAANLHVHKIDFIDVVGIFEGPIVVRRSDRNDELRYQVFGYVDGREVAVACTIRGGSCRIISARRARRDERQKYHDRLARHHGEGQDELG